MSISVRLPAAELVARELRVTIIYSQVHARRDHRVSPAASRRRPPSTRPTPCSGPWTLRARVARLVRVDEEGELTELLLRRRRVASGWFFFLLLSSQLQAPSLSNSHELAVPSLLVYK